MPPINRSVAIIRPKQPFVDWSNQLPDGGPKVSLDNFRHNCTVILIPEYDTHRQTKSYINQIYEDIFEEELWGWCTEESWWPKDRTKELFWQWFEVELHSIVLDSLDESIEKEDW
jgi:hypothetical protein